MKKVTIFEVGPRDGFQNVSEWIPTETKIEIIEKTVEAGINTMQITSFVSPKAIPQLKDAKEVVAYFNEHHPELKQYALVPNLFGAKAARDAGLKHVNYVVSLSKSHNKANINRTHEESFAELDKILEEVPELEVGVDVATVFGCPFEGKYETEVVVDFVRQVYDRGIRNITVADTIGIANPKQVRDILGALLKEFPDVHFTAHIHDTRNMGIVNTLAAIEAGVDSVQSSLGGLGGCPFAPGASGNTATEDLVYMLEAMGYDTGVDFKKLKDAMHVLKEHVDGSYSSHQLNLKDEVVL